MAGVILHEALVGEFGDDRVRIECLLLESKSPLGYFEVLDFSIA